MGFFSVAATLHKEGDIVHAHGLTRIGGGDDRLEFSPDFHPDFEQIAAKRPGMLVERDAGIGIVVEKGAITAPGNEHRLAGGQHQADERLERLRPGGCLAQRRRRPILRAHQAAELAAFNEEGSLVFAARRSSQAEFPSSQFRTGECRRSRRIGAHGGRASIWPNAQTWNEYQ